MLLDENLIETEKASAPSPSKDKTLHVVRRLRRAFLSICRCGDVMFSPYRLTTEQYSLMLAVHRDPGIRQVDVRDRIFAEPNTVTAMVTLLERRGILRRKSSPLDGRVRLLYLTAHGQAVMKRLSEDWEPMRTLLRQCFSGKAGQEALEILDTVYEAMGRERELLLQKPYADHPLDRDFDDVDDRESLSAPLAGRGKSDQAAATQAQSRKEHAAASARGKRKGRSAESS